MAASRVLTCYRTLRATLLAIGQNPSRQLLPNKKGAPFDAPFPNRN